MIWKRILHMRFIREIQQRGIAILYVELLCFLCYSEHGAEQAGGLPMFWDAVTLMWHHCNAITPFITINVLFLWFTGDAVRISNKGRKYVTTLGDSKELPCTVVGRDFDPFTHVVIWYKLEGGQEFQINTMATTNALFDGVGRYAINFNRTTDGNVPAYMFTLALTSK